MFSMEAMKTMWKSNLSTTTNTEDENKTKNSQEHQEATKIENANKINLQTRRDFRLAR